ncbi:MAG: pilus assembly protein PilP [Gammaproteobacteria bacterium]|nr:MAG: pilus assembly protein PilP [Gammaproteobacteria bacterium]
MAETLTRQARPTGQRPASGTVRLLAVLAAALLLSACGNDMSDLKQYVEATKAKKHGRIEPIPEIKSYEAFEYPGHERDPFDPSAVAAKVEKGKALSENLVSVDTSRPPEYLESFPLDTLRMAGTLERNGELWALVRTPDGTIQRVHEGNYMGQNYGRIIRITEDEIVLEEKVPDGMGHFVKRENALKMSSGEE